VSTKAEFFARIHDQMRKTRGLFAASVATRPEHPALQADTIRRELAERWPETLEKFRREFERVGGVFYRVASVDDLSHALEAGGLDVHEMPAAEAEDAASRERLRAIAARADLGLTGVDLAVAETGTLILMSGVGRPRSTSLLPPYHVAVFDRTALVESLHQVGVFLEAWHGDGAPPGTGAVINFITGPSRTADIELTLTRGVHGPREVHAIFVEGGIRG